MQHTLPSHQAVTGLKTNTGHYRWVGWHASRVGGLVGFSPRVGRPCGAGIAMVEADVMTHLKQGRSGMRGLCQVDLLIPHPSPRLAGGHMPSAWHDICLFMEADAERSHTWVHNEIQMVLQGGAWQPRPGVGPTLGSVGPGGLACLFLSFQQHLCPGAAGMEVLSPHSAACLP